MRRFGLAVAATLLVGSAVGDNACWKTTYGRGVGKVLNTCDSGNEKSGLLCYPVCADGFTGFGPVCWENCPQGFNDIGVGCLKPAKAYGRGVGYVDKTQCEHDHPSGCEKNGLLFYPICGSGFHAVGCCVCSPDCPANMTDIGVSCQKKSYGRGFGSALKCGGGLEQSGALCYSACNATDPHGVGPICWGDCPTGWNDCAGAMCTQTTDICTDSVKQVIEGAIDLAESIAGAASGEIDLSKIVKGIAGAGDLAGALIHPLCSATSYILK